MIWDRALVFLVSTIGQVAVDTWRKNSEVEAHVRNLRVALPKAQLLIERAECWRLPEYNPIDSLLPQLKDSIYEAESILDELQYQSLKHKVEKGSIPGTKFIVKWIEKWMRDFPTAVKMVLDTLNKIHDDIKQICDSRGIPENPKKFSQNARPITSTYRDQSCILYGREKELKEVICLMGIPSFGSCKRKRGKGVSMPNSDIGESSSRMDKKQNVSILSIVGMGGVGKTTLAQMVCEDKTVKAYFDLIMWVCVSDNFDLVRLTKEMIEKATTQGCNLTNLDAMQSGLEKALKSKKCLLVLDDVWSKNWQPVLAPMKEASEGRLQ